MHRPRRFPAVIAAAALLCGGRTACALDRVSLRNGFSYDCAREQAIDDEHTRLYLSAASDSGYVDVVSGEIVAVDALPATARPPVASSSSAAGPTGQVHARQADVDGLLQAAGLDRNIDAALLASLVHAESSGHARAVSHAGAQGLMQLMHSTARTYGVTDSFAPEQNIHGGTAYLDALLTRYHDNLALALAAYNAGPAAVDRYHGVPPYRETQAYVARVMTEFKRRKQGLTHKASAQPSATMASVESGHP